MKKHFLFLSGVFIATTAFSQTAITLNASDIPVPTIPFTIYELPGMTAPTLGANTAWDISGMAGTIAAPNTYVAETDALFTNAGVDVWTTSSKSLGPDLGYDIETKIDFNANKVEDKGMYVPKQAYSLTLFSGGANDSLTIPAQSYLATTSSTYMQFPMTANSTWSSTSRREVNFTLNAPAFGLNKAASKHVYYLTRKDSIAAWGTVRVYTPKGPSIAYEVLVNQGMQYAIDSFYLGGAPAPAMLLTAFSVAQGQKTDERYYIQLHRAGSFNYLVRYYFGNDATYTAVNNAYYNTDNLTTTSLESPISGSYMSVVFPNPINGNLLQVQLLGNNTPLASYAIMDMTGKTVQTGTPTAGSMGSASILLENGLANGNYTLLLRDRDNHPLATEKFQIAR